MSKYDFGDNITDDTAIGKILAKLTPNSNILEFGCACGRMTRYMKEELNCSVRIVEYEKSAYDIAVKYAVDGVCGDILEYEWIEKFKGVKFDAILFVDVLEHVSDPLTVLKKAATLLSENGSIYISIPNITHNDVIIKEIDDRFDYTNVGLLDDTHIHFWGLNNIEEFAQKAGLKVTDIDGTFIPVGSTEQLANEDIPVSRLMINLLRKRDCGEIYQFIISLSKSCESSPKYSYRYTRPAIQCQLYLDKGLGYSEDDKIISCARLEDNEGYQADIIAKCSDGLQQVRFDPIEGQCCILRNLEIMQGDEHLSFKTNDAVYLDNDILLAGDDPFVCADIDQDAGDIHIKAEILLPDENFINYVTNYIMRIKHDLDKVKESEIETRSVLDSYRTLVDTKDSFWLGVDRIMYNKDQLINKQRKQLDYYNDLFVIKIHNKIKKIVKRIKLLMKGKDEQ